MRTKTIIKNITSLLILQVITVICGFIVPKVIITTYGSEVNGLITSLTKFIAYITLLELGFGPVVKALLYKEIAKKRKKRIIDILYESEKFFRRIAYIFIGYLVFLSILMCFIIKDFDPLYTILLLLIIASSTFFEYYYGITYKLYLDAKQRTYIISIIQIITLIICTIIVVVLANLNVSIHLIKLICAFVYIARSLSYNIYVKRKYNYNLSKANKNYKIERKMDGFPQHLAYVVHNNLDVLLLTIFSSLSFVSVYYVYMIIINSIKSILQSITSGADATLGDMMAKDIDINGLFRKYEILYYTVLTILFACTLLLIVPFISVYTKGITDVNYVIPLFAYLIVIAEFIWAIRLPYSGITIAKGHFQQIKVASYVEIIVNIVISLILVSKYNLVGVAIGTLVAMTTRTIHFIYHASKGILFRKLGDAIKCLIIMIIELLIIIIIFNTINSNQINGYFDWLIKAIKVFSVSVMVVIPINLLLYKNILFKRG